jgi:SAM-dependent methyltransferase
MNVCCQKLSDVARYLEANKDVSLKAKAPEFERLMKIIRSLGHSPSKSHMLEIGTGTGWLPLLCSQSGIRCKGLEISPDLVEFAMNLGKRNSLTPEIEVGNIESADIGEEAFDVIFANSSFEHVQNWQVAVQKVFRALRPGGLFIFDSTNRFSLVSGEYPAFLYGWWPNKVRYAYRVRKQGPDIMKLGIDFHQFTHWQLRSFFTKTGFSRVFDNLQLSVADHDPNTSKVKRVAIKVMKRLPVLRHPVLFFSRGTRFVCVK